MKQFLNILIILITLLCTSLSATAANKSDNYVLLPDSSNFVTASLVVVSPGENVYSALGHCAIRLECPIHKLDYCFSFGTNTATDKDFLQFFAGKLEAGFLALPTEGFMKEYEMEGREVKQVELNLTLHEQQRLWQMLDEDMVGGNFRTFNYLQNNCSSLAFKAIEWCLIGEQLTVNKWPQQMEMINGDGVRYLSRHRPWLSFVNMTLLGTESDTYWEQEHRISPELIIDALNHATISPIDSVAPRPVFKSKPVTLLKKRSEISTTPATPFVVFGILLAIAVIITVLEWCLRMHKVARIFDAILLIAQTIAGIVLIYMSAVACLFGLHWNWYLIVFNPLPAILWLTFRKKDFYPKVYLAYSIILLVFIAIWPLTTQIDLEHQLITMALLTRCASRYFATREKQLNTTSQL